LEWNNKGMKNTSLISILLIISLSILSASCWRTSDKKVNVDKFYTQKGEWDSGRIPLIKPYEAVITSKEFGWFINLDGKDGDTGLPNISKVAVKRGVIYLYNINTILHGIDVKQSWHVIIPDKQIEKGFATHQEYSEYLSNIGIKEEPQLYDIKSVADYFENHDVIDWNVIKN